jgi:hypothetical protein
MIVSFVVWVNVKNTSLGAKLGWADEKEAVEWKSEGGEK